MLYLLLNVTFNNLVLLTSLMMINEGKSILEHWIVYPNLTQYSARPSR